MNTQEKSRCQAEAVLEVLEPSLELAVTRGKEIVKAIDRAQETGELTVAQERVLRRLRKGLKKGGKRARKLRREVRAVRKRL
jgi:hypothetical protein